jgi:cytochrome c oxidase assembly factor CtaG
MTRIRGLRVALVTAVAVGWPARLGAALAAAVGWLALPIVVLAHGADSILPPKPSDLLLDWTFDPTVVLPLLVVGLGYLVAVRRVNERHPTNPFPRGRVVCFVAGLLVIEVALQSIVERYDTTLFSVHMVQHVLLTLVASPLLALGAPITLALRFARPEFRRRWILPLLHSRVVRAVTFPPVAWVLFAGAMWGTHFSPIFDASLTEPLLHQAEHAIYLTVGLLFWWPAVGADPSPWRMPHPVRALYLFLQMPQNTFLALAIYGASEPLYPHYTAISLLMPWAPAPLADQQLAGGLMWVIGDVIFILAIVLVVAGWMRSEERDASRRDRQDDAARAAIRAREAALAERLARERSGQG